MSFSSLSTNVSSFTKIKSRLHSPFSRWISTQTHPSIPTIHINEFNKSPYLIAQQMYNACNIGVFSITGHNVNNKLCNDLFKQSHDFFQLQAEEKLKIHVQKGGIAWRGYMPIGGEQTHGNIDLKEGLYLGPEHNSDHKRVISGTPLYGRNQFPQDNSELQKIVQEYIDAVTNVGNILTNAISVSLGLETDYILKNYIMNDPIALFRLWKYPKTDKNDKYVSESGIGEHSDYGFLTIIKPSCEGLQFKLPVNSSNEIVSEDVDINYENKWIDIKISDDALVVNVGDLLDKITYGRFKSREHRVINNRNEDRYSNVLFYDPCWDCDMKYLPIDPIYNIETEKRWSKTAYKNLNGKYSQYLAKKVKNVFPQLLKDYQFDDARAESTRFHIAVAN
eukprot:473835_1